MLKMNLDEIIRTYGAIPDLTSFKRPLFVGPHPDDIEFGCGGLISRFKELGTPVTYCIVTDGAAGSNDPAITPEMMKQTRKKESLNAAAFMNVSNVEMLELEDGGDYEVSDVIRKLAPVVLRCSPDIIFAPDARLKTECHPDHLKTGEAARRVTQLVSHPESLRRHKVDIKGIETFPSNITLAFYFSDDSNTLLQISESNLGDKIQALMLHESQMQDSSTELLLNYFKLKALKLGNGQGLAEDYQVLVPLTQHVYAEGIHY